jgi:hypothetical protein
MREKVCYVDGYTSGSLSGHLDACGLFTQEPEGRLPRISTPSGVVLDPCQGRARNWVQGSVELVRQIDTFYSRYPKDRNIQVVSLIQNLSDQAGLTIDQIHAMGSGL